MPNPRALLLWEAVEHGGPYLLGSYRAPRESLGDLSLSVPDLSGLSSSIDTSTLPFLIGLGGVLLFVLWEQTPAVKTSKGKLTVARRKKSSLGTGTALTLILGAASAAYLYGRYATSTGVTNV
jgi:hypothetical protein